MILCKIAMWLFFSLWVIANVYETYSKSGEEMYAELVNGQCVVGLVAANIFYAPAWILKVVKGFIK